MDHSSHLPETQKKPQQMPEKKKKISMLWQGDKNTKS